VGWPSTWTDRAGRDRTPSILGHELAGVVTSLGYGTTGLSVGQRVFGLADWHRDGTLAEYLAIEARNLDILRRYLPDAAVDLVYLDPPFNSNRDYNVIFRDESGNATDQESLTHVRLAN
jgi:hypothetical protein